MNGFEAAKNITNLIIEENYIDTMLISYSCNAGIEFEDKCKKLGF